MAFSCGVDVKVNTTLVVFTEPPLLLAVVCLSR